MKYAEYRILTPDLDEPASFIYEINNLGIATRIVMMFVDGRLEWDEVDGQRKIIVWDRFNVEMLGQESPGVDVKIIDKILFDRIFSKAKKSGSRSADLC